MPWQNAKKNFGFNEPEMFYEMLDESMIDIEYVNEQLTDIPDFYSHDD